MRPCHALLPPILVLCACATDPSSSPLAPRDPLFAKPAPGATDPTASFAFPLDDAALGVRSDHKYTSGATSVYAEGVCGVHAKIFATNALSGSGDAIMHTDNPSFSDRKCKDYPRKMIVDLGTGTVDTSTVFINVNQVENDFYQIRVGDTVKRGLNLGETKCNGMAWKQVLQDGTSIDADSVLVTREDARTWTVRTQPYPYDRARCAADGQSYHVPVFFTITASRDLP